MKARLRKLEISVKRLGHDVRCESIEPRESIKPRDEWLF